VVRIFAGIVVFPHVLTTVIAVGKQAALERVPSVLIAGATIAAKAAPDAQQECVSGIQVLDPSLEACCVHARYVYQSEPDLPNAAD
jgi:hypothetical protein